MTAADASTIETAVVVVGGGDAGLAAAIEARALGCDVVLMEKNAELGGSTGFDRLDHVEPDTASAQA